MQPLTIYPHTNWRGDYQICTFMTGETQPSFSAAVRIGGYVDIALQYSEPKFLGTCGRFVEHFGSIQCPLNAALRTDEAAEAQYAVSSSQ
ncbi:hypothetical protein FHS01_004042 [Longimicrobium terrae]|uniref:Uncharacterized protein n=1 Tax=Longimicrobium terrae TaxID=1639882 RepID=A0A841H2K3_9BACT|nr:hypothetical protein [Longimicrobium terrae]MBB6072230.1 hypothetical protein [Longimicrobium terrae]